MKILDNKNLIVTRPFLGGGSFRGAEVLPSEDSFKLLKTEVIVGGKPKLKMIFKTDDGEQERVGWIELKENSGLTLDYLERINLELDKMNGRTWTEITSHDFLLGGRI